MKLWVTEVYVAIESNWINSCKENPARGIKYDSTVSVMLCNSSLGSPHYITPRGKSPCHTLNETQRVEQAAGSAACPVLLPTCLLVATISMRWHLMGVQLYLWPVHKPTTGVIAHKWWHWSTLLRSDHETWCRHKRLRITALQQQLTTNIPLTCLNMSKS